MEESSFHSNQALKDLDPLFRSRHLGWVSYKKIYFQYIYLLNRKAQCLLLTTIQKYLWFQRQIFKKSFAEISSLHIVPSAEDNRIIPKIRSKDAFSHINNFKTKIFLSLKIIPLTWSQTPQTLRDEVPWCDQNRLWLLPYPQQLPPSE